MARLLAMVNPAIERPPASILTREKPIPVLLNSIFDNDRRLLHTLATSQLAFLVSTIAACAHLDGTRRAWPFVTSRLARMVPTPEPLPANLPTGWAGRFAGAARGKVRAAE